MRQIYYYRLGSIAARLGCYAVRAGLKLRAAVALPPIFTLGKVNYTFIKNTIPVVAEDLGVSGYNTRANEERNKGAFVMDAESMDIDRLLSRSQSLAQSKGKGGDK